MHHKHSLETLLVTISGHVQGVGFRAATVRHAHLQGVKGWVRNLDDGTVQALLQGPHDQVDRMLSWLHHGPPNARVDLVEHQEEHTGRYFDRFEAI
ncbi:acylphosphatase [Pollutimonas harenae]|uniref:Acylphosphatase n=1 Tax=Pollutimonas harenae TaxID=657015 RepID=A0A853H647_9BURK|nr:acylphosphatase [Pollutimonas harenae]NYT85993.1 acylphosphatase [Pollutimonas harenae]TEA71042.1 acylphosphatase [Pollutimonas harenae]